MVSWPQPSMNGPASAVEMSCCHLICWGHNPKVGGSNIYYFSHGHWFWARRTTLASRAGPGVADYHRSCDDRRCCFFHSEQILGNGNPRRSALARHRNDRVCCHFLSRIYGGFFSGGYVIMLTAVFVVLLGMSFLQAVATTKVIRVFF